MPLIEGEVTIVLAGAWNPAIFTPDWVHQKLFADDDDLVVEVLCGEISGLRFLSEGVALVVLPGRVQVSPVQNDDESLARAERVATDLLAALPETPRQARGINVVVREPMTEVYAPLFRDPPSIPAADMQTIEARRVGWQFRDGGDQINVQAESGPGGVSIAFNFHRSGKNAEVLGASIAGSVRSSILRTRDITRWMGAIPVEATT